MNQLINLNRHTHVYHQTIPVVFSIHRFLEVPKFLSLYLRTLYYKHSALFGCGSVSASSPVFLSLFPLTIPRRPPMLR